MPLGRGPRGGRGRLTGWGCWPIRHLQGADALERRRPRVVLLERARSPGRSGPELRRVESSRERRRRPGLGRIMLAATKVLEDPRNHARLGDGGDETNLAGASGTATELDTPDTLEASHPAHRGAAGGRGVLARVRAGVCGGAGDDERTVARPRGKQAVVSNQVGPGPRHQPALFEPCLVGVCLQGCCLRDVAMWGYQNNDRFPGEGRWRRPVR